MLSNYRLGDIIILGRNNEEINHDIVTEHPNTIGSDYVLSSQDKTNRVHVITQIILNHIQKHEHLFPADIENSTVVHLRLGDAVGGSHWYERRLRPFDLSYYQSIISDINIDTSNGSNGSNGSVYIIGKCHFGKGESSTNYEECMELSKKHINDVLHLLKATHFDGGHPDIDLCLAVKAKQFVQGRGYYSQLIVSVRHMLGRNSIKTQSHNWTVPETDV